MMRFLVGTVAHNAHIQNILRSLYEAGALGKFCTGGVDHWKSSMSQRVRNTACKWVPDMQARLTKRRILSVPEEFISADWKWEGCRLLARQAGLGTLIEDWLWERSEYALDRKCAQLMKSSRWDAFLGVEHGALFSIQAAKSAGKKAAVAFLSPHHKTREFWVDKHYEQFPELLSPATRRLRDLARERDARRDAEAGMVDVVHCASGFTRDSLIAGGIAHQKIMTVPLGCPKTISVRHLRERPAALGTRFLYAGAVAVHKGAHVLLKSWDLLGTNNSAELHIYGAVTLPRHVIAKHRAGVFFHGNVSKAEMARAYQSSSVLVFPTLCDGFGMVVAEALAQGVPVITTCNAGAADLIVNGHNGFLVPAGDVGALAERMHWCLDHPQDVHAMREEALATASRWTWADFRSSFRNQLFNRLGFDAAA